MKFAVIGAGNTGQAMAGHLSIMGNEVKLYDRNAKKVEEINNSGIELRNALTGKASVKATTDICQCIEGADFIMVMTTAQAHSIVCRQMQPFLQDGQTIIIFNGNWGALEFKEILSETLLKKNIIIAETGAMIYIGNSPEAGIVNVKQVKNKISLSCIPAAKSIEIVDRLKDIYPQFTAADSILETSLNNSNTIIHTPITLLNWARIEFGQEFLFYADGASASSVKYVEQMDKERVKIAQAMGVKSQSVLEIINSFWTDKHDNLYDAIHLNKSYKIAKGPRSLDHRYITEDIPFGIVPLAKLAKLFNVETPCINGLIAIASILLDKDLMSEGPDFSKFYLEEYI